MAEEAKQTLVVDKSQLRTDFHHMRHALERYRDFLAGNGGEAGNGDGWPQSAVTHLRDQQLALLQARVSLGSVELTCALLRTVLGRLSVESLRFQPRNGNGGPPAGSPDEGAPALSTLLGWLNAAARAAPLELQERLQRLLAGIGDLFAALAEESAERIEAAIVRVNLVTANAESRNLLREIAIVTRDIYRTLQSVSDELPLEGLTESSGGIPEAVQRLNSVMVRLDEAATQNLDHLEQVNRICDEGTASLGGVISTLRAAQKRLMQIKAEHPALEDALTRVQERLSDEVGAPVMTLQHQLGKAVEQHMELISNQSFQELTSRTLKKIIDFVEALEYQLYELLKQYRPTAEVPRPVAVGAEAPAEAPAPGTQQSQDDVDKLLGELGF